MRPDSEGTLYHQPVQSPMRLKRLKAEPSCRLWSSVPLLPSISITYPEEYADPWGQQIVKAHPPSVQGPDADQEHGSVPCRCPSAGGPSPTHPYYQQSPHLLNHDSHHAFSHRTKHLIAKTDQPFSPHTPLTLTHTGLQPSHNLTIFLRSRMHPPDLLRDSLYSPKIYFKAT